MFKQLIVRLVLTTFFFTSIGPLPDASAQNVIDLPAPGVMVNESIHFEPLQLKGILVNVKNPLSFDFLIDKGDSNLYGQPLKNEITRLAKYFLTCLTVPENDLWVNLSPYEKDRIVPDNFGITLMGKDLLEQDYLLKQIMASLSYPENNLGKLFWQRVYHKAYELYGTTDIPINTFNKVWILPKSADVYAQGNGAFVIKSQLDVMLEADYKSYVHHLNNKNLGADPHGFSQKAGAYSQVFRDVILPELRNEVNEGENFAVVRQVYNAMILATWYKRHLRDSLLGRMYVGKNEVRGVDITDKNAKEKIFQQYLKAYKKCVYNYIKEDYDPVTQQTVPRKYASGGMYFSGFGGPASVYMEKPNPKGMKIGADLAMATVDVTATNSDGKIIRFPDMRAEITNTNPFHQVPLEARGFTFSGKNRKANFENIAMLVPKSLRPLVISLVLAVGGLAMTPMIASAAQPVFSAVPVQTPAEMLADQVVPSAIASGIIVNAPPAQIGTHFFTIPSPPKNGTDSKILQFMKLKLPWYTGIAILGIGIGSILVSRTRSNKKTLNMAVSVQKVNSSAFLRPVIETSSQIAATTPEEIVLLPQLKAQLNKILADRASLAVLEGQDTMGGTSWPDIFAWLGGMALAGLNYNSDPVSLIATALALPMVNAAYSTSNVWLHEIGHALAAAVLYPMPKYWKRSLRPSNLRGNFSLGQWKGFFLSKLLGKNYQGENPYVSFPAKGWRDLGISWTGIGVTTLANGAAFAAALMSSLDHTCLIPLLGVIGVNGYSAIKAALIGDISGSLQNKNNDERMYPCGISVHNRIVKRNDLVARNYKDSLNRLGEMMRTEGDRGVHEAGAMTMLPGEDGKVHVQVEKSVEGLRGPKSDSISRVINKLGSELPEIPPNDTTGNEYIMYTLIGHNRLASGGIVEENAAHPHLGPIHKKVLWSLQNGILVEGNGLTPQLGVDVARPPKSEDENEQNVAAGAAHNGDGDAYQPVPGDRYIDDLDELRALAIELVHFQGELPPGDSPIIPLLIQFHLTQGNSDASVRFAHVREHHKTIEELKGDLLTENEEIVAGEILDRGIRKFGAILSRPGITNPDKTIKDLYVSRKMAEENPNDQQIQFQYTALQELKKYLANEYKKAAQAGRLPEKIARHWHGVDADQVINNFVNMAVYKFFTGDRDTACKEFEERSKGTYGLAVKVSTDLNGLSLLSRRLGMVYGYNLEKGYLDASSDPYALLKKYKNGDQLNTLVYLDPKGKGEIANFHVSRLTGKLHLQIFSFNLNRYLTDEEIRDREYPLTPDNKYYRPLHEYADEKSRIIEDMNVITPSVANLVASFDDKNGSKPPGRQAFNYQSGMEVFKNLMAYWIYEKIDTKMMEGGEYNSIFQKINQVAVSLQVQCFASNCPETQKEFLRQEAVATPENSVLMALLCRWLSQDSLKLANRLINRGIDQKKLQALIPIIIQNRCDQMLWLLRANNLGLIYKYWDQERKHPFSGKEKIGMLFAGDENSDNGPRSSEDSWNALLPDLPKRFVSSHELLDYNSLPFDVTSPWVTLLTSKAGGNFNTMQALDIMVNAVGIDHVWGATGRPDSPLSVALGQRLRPDSEFKRHTFYTGDHYRAQTQGASETLTSALHNLLPVFVALEFEKYCPGEHPFGLNLDPQKVEYLKRLMQDMMVTDAKRITGRDKDGDQVLTKVNKELVKRGQFLARRLWEAPLVLWTHRLFVYLIFLGGPFILGYLQFFGIVPGPPLNSWSGFLTATADYLFTMFAPWGITLFYRKLTNYNPWVLQGPPTNICVVGKGSVPETQEMFLRVVFSRAFVNWGTQVLSQNYEKAISRLGPALKRGSWIFAHIPATFLKRNAIGAIKQLKVTKVGLFGTKNKRTGAVSFTTSRGPYNDPNGVVSNYNVDLEGTEFFPPKDDVMARVYNNFDAWGANLAFKMASSVMTYILTFGGRLWNPSKVNSALSLTTESGQQPPEKMPKDNAQITTTDNTSRDGGIVMNSRLMHLNITGETQDKVGVQDNAMPVTLIKGVVPQVSGIITVTPGMLKTMLGEGYLN